MTLSIIHHRRGDHFSRRFVLQGEWLAVHFSEAWFTVRTRLPTSAVTDDEPSDPTILAQVTLSGGGIEWLDEREASVRIADAVTQTWPTGAFFWDLQFRTAGTSQRIYTPASGTIRVTSDVTRAR